ncbi:MAG TPA: BadF/BadG/BcrA/BcrD ATPase family protein [Xanthobacteraceae bacterium]|jgi:glucosamine kinase|nr:BadF/BadG/BcrA/BcrD ATPase family protein [Xanthobacteraceae bacterium]
MNAALPSGPLFVGVDGGGTGCRARLENAEGRLLGTGIAGPATLRIGVECALAEVEKACRGALEESGFDSGALSSVHAAVGLAGMGRKGSREALARHSHPFHSVVYAHDATIACIGAHGARDGGIIIVGTGSIGFAVVGGREIRVGGYGFPISDEGSGADLGLHAIRLALRAHDERVINTGFTRDVMTRFRGDPFEAVAWTDRATATDYATFAPLVMRHADDGDQIARRIVRDAAEQIDELIRRLSECGAPRIALLGGLASSMRQWLAPDVQRRLVAVEGDAVDGALHLARRAVLKGR